MHLRASLAILVLAHGASAISAPHPQGQQEKGAREPGGKKAEGGKKTRPPGVWHTPTRPLPRIGGVLDDAQAKSLRDLANLPYLSGFKSAEARPLIARHHPDKAFDGLNLLISSHAPEARLVDMLGETVHTWSCAFEDAWPPGPDAPLPERLSSWRRVHLFGNGDLLVVFEGQGIVKLDVDSKVLWKRRGHFHHDLCVADDGKIYALGRRRSRKFPGIDVAVPRVADDTVVVLDRDGEVVDRVSVLETFATSRYRPIIPRPVTHRDLFHTNTIEVLDGRFADRAPWLAKGNVLISCRNLSTIAVVDLDARRVVWALHGEMWHRQHQPSFVDDGRILLFDNLGGPSPRGRSAPASQVMEFDPLTQEVSWLYRGTVADPFLCPILGSCQRLLNGNTLVSDSVNGRAFEVTREGEIVWEYFSPHRAGEDDELVASMPEMIRVRREDLAFLAR